MAIGTLPIPLNANCSYPNYSWSSEVCSGNGECIDSICVCNAGWTGASDWVSGDGYDCQTNYYFVSALWVIAVLMGLKVSIKLTIPALKKYINASTSFKETWRKPMFHLLFTVTVFQLSLLPVAVWKITNTALIGNEDPICFLIYAFYTCVFYYITTVGTALQCNLALKSMTGRDKTGVKRVLKLVVPKVGNSRASTR
jgi:hypothetical protein